MVLARILLTSMLGDELPFVTLTKRGLLDAGIPYLAKPFSSEALARMMRAVLSSAAPTS